jgi:hypothetical protein
MMTPRLQKKKNLWTLQNIPSEWGFDPHHLRGCQLTLASLEKNTSRRPEHKLFLALMFFFY